MVAPQAPWSLDDFVVVPEPGKTRFHDCQLPLELLHAISDLGFQYCSPIQAETLPNSLAGRDVIGQAQTGTGKTAAFLITLITAFLAKPRGAEQPAATPRALILAPTRELVIQIGKEAEALAKYSGLTVLTVFGGIDYQKQRLQITAGPVDIMVATPGRLIDFQRQKTVHLNKVEILVLDEADRMLDMGFIPDVRRIVQSTPPKEERQTLFFSATMTPEVNHLAAQWTKKPVHVEIVPERVAVDSVEQIVYLATAKEKYDLLYNLITSQDLQRVMVFANRRDETRKLTERLKRN
ncbi:MAG TPA: DEAD/DEAH box helicase, partial [Desulfurivibrionaceae bacterium]|nr:DEAD/DEAH box helicase [Desulfurivibrionaceae bacterium]